MHRDAGTTSSTPATVADASAGAKTDAGADADAGDTTFSPKLSPSLTHLSSGTISVISTVVKVLEDENDEPSNLAHSTSAR